MESTNIFNDQMYTEVESNTFDLSHEHKTTLKFGYLYPMLVDEVLPGDRWTFSTQKMLRMMPLIAPVMHRIKIYEHWFFVPNRINYKDWDQFITGQTFGPQDITIPQCSWVDATKVPVNSTLKQSIGVYMGLPYASSPQNFSLVSLLPLAGYISIWNEYYRDNNLQTPLVIDLVSGVNVVAPAVGANIGRAYEAPPLIKAYKKDYFTSALPSAQKGLPVQIPLNGINKLQVALRTVAEGGTLGNLAVRADNRAAFGNSGTFTVSNVTNKIFNTTSGQDAVINPNGQWVIDPANAATINSFRTALALQAFLEKDIQGGQRYNETIISHFAVTPSDFRLQRPEYLGGSVQNVQITEVLSQTETIVGSEYTPIGQMAGHGLSISTSEQNTYFAEEHGYIYCIVSVEPDLAYKNQGLHRMWKRFGRTDYAWPSFAHLGEQEIKYEELLVNHNNPQGTFGYTPRYSEYKYKASRATSEFIDTLDFWNLAVSFPTNQLLNEGFIQILEVQKNLTRIFAISPEKEGIVNDYMVAQIYFDIQVDRRLPRFAVPQLVG